MCLMVVMMMSLDNQGYDWSHIPSAADFALVVVVFVVLLIVMMVVMVFVLVVA